MRNSWLKVWIWRYINITFHFHTLIVSEIISKLYYFITSEIISEPHWKHLILKMVSLFGEWANRMKISLSSLSTLKLHVRWFTKVDEHPRTPHSNRFDMVVVTSIFLRAALPPRFGSPWKMHNLVLSALKPSADCKLSHGNFFFTFRKRCTIKNWNVDRDTDSFLANRFRNRDICRKIIINGRTFFSL